MRSPEHSDLTFRFARRAALLIALASALISGVVAQTHPPAEAPAKSAVPERSNKESTTPPSSSAEPVIPQVAIVRPKQQSWPAAVDAQGNIQPWQEIHISAEVDGLRVNSVLASLGDVVKKGQVLARLNSASVEAELDSATAQLNEAKAAQAQAASTLERATRLAPSGGISKQELTLYETQKRTADARYSAALALVKKQQLRLEQATIGAPDDGVISSRTVVEGAIVQTGNELFRMIRQGRLQWRAEVPGDLLLRVAPGQEVLVKSPLGEAIKGRVRQVSPTIDVATQKGAVFVDLPTDSNLKAGLSVSGTLNAGKRQVLALPASVIRSRNGVETVLTVNQDNRIEIVEIKTGERRDKFVEVLSPLDEKTRVLADKIDTLTPGDSVSILPRAAAPAAPAIPAPTPAN
ncbi:efflux RND transporter periplasmic adaptor subunit [Propionivibrio dicarboxylicus]|uniref:RND family efflux transporter, MFP subunit n=1 Tax=Propionivibrio dicarboxylicus TaxID=83767 RepID=A0A1G7Y593_9RHOO|nr:efflux RND transporter periplasmic adaptor subunit [Propionivibrio dicarboxylicus]SDG91150.1 RND family efflux transporter, MFP subunit [Propionivibrio dicarboxylicus]